MRKYSGAIDAARKEKPDIEYRVCDPCKLGLGNGKDQVCHVIAHRLIAGNILRSVEAGNIILAGARARAAVMSLI
jgi:hypothetical protein